MFALTRLARSPRSLVFYNILFKYHSPFFFLLWFVITLLKLPLANFLFFTHSVPLLTLFVGFLFINNYPFLFFYVAFGSFLLFSLVSLFSSCYFAASSACIFISFVLILLLSLFNYNPSFFYYTIILFIFLKVSWYPSRVQIHILSFFFVVNIYF